MVVFTAAPHATAKSFGSELLLTTNSPPCDLRSVRSDPQSYRSFGSKIRETVRSTAKCVRPLSHVPFPLTAYTFLKHVDMKLPKKSSVACFEAQIVVAFVVASRVVASRKSLSFYLDSSSLNGPLR